MLDLLGDLKRTHMCGALRLTDAGKNVVLMGWVNRRRDLGQIIFVDLRDRTGVTQVVFNHEVNAGVHQKAEALRNEFVIAAIGTIKRRDADTINPNIPTGEVELVVEELRILNVSTVLATDVAAELGLMLGERVMVGQESDDASKRRLCGIRRVVFRADPVQTSRGADIAAFYPGG